MKSGQKGFTIVEMIIVIVVIAILSALVFVGYTGVTNNAQQAAIKSDLGNQADKIKVAMLDGGYPVSLAAASLPTSSSNGDIAFRYTRDADGRDFCLTALYKNKTAYNIGGSGAPASGPCDGHSGGTDYCPTDTYVPINGFYCEGTVGAIATRNTGAVKLLSSTAPVPANAPGAYVGRQTSRDNLINNSFPVVPGETYCIEGWVSTASSTVSHALGLMYNNGSANSWVNFGTTSAASATGLWVKAGSCQVVPAGQVTGHVWTQNDGTPGSTADVAWYQTALRFWKQ